MIRLGILLVLGRILIIMINDFGNNSNSLMRVGIVVAKIVGVIILKMAVRPGSCPVCQSLTAADP